MADIRSLQLSDLPELHQQEQRCFPQEAWSESLLRLQLSDMNRCSFGFFSEDLSAFACFSKVLDEAELLQVGVTPVLRNQGIAKTLLLECFNQLRSQQVTRVMLEVRAGNKAALALYYSLGFVIDGLRKNYYPATEAHAIEDAVLMSLVLDK